jgi:type II secretory pathway component PulJ
VGPGEGGIVAGRRPPRPSDGGFTIVELLVAVLLTVVLLGITVQVFIKARHYKARSERNVELSATARAVGQLVRRDLAGCYLYQSAADAFDLDTSPGDPDIDGHELTLWTATANLGASELAEVVYYAKNGRLYRVVNAYRFNESASYADADFALAAEVSGLEFYPDPAGGWPRRVRVVLRLDDELAGRTRTYTERIVIPVEE